jgi:hypothetical protein
VHELPTLRWTSAAVPVHVAVRRDEDGMWRGRLLFGPPEAPVPTAEILCAASEADLWQAVHGLNVHHLRDLYRSVTDD